ncbi:MAG: tRNA (adenosine(37)-N6)-threonylcarbamoyltransferase complex ATPase subunit type 1 TsaE [Planctomycetes bacterium GWF2_50_10]|nr:MAG: tRNA (adenosine(37)-N6)-threonylcarbamoyltransferase complex ATPase subunit type 1 TsaE [Planctomycetes bacterium GWF2_50_10]
MPSKEIISNSPEQTIRIGINFSANLKGGEIISLTGPLGAGKTHFVKGLALGLGAGPGHNVSSPTFVLVNEYSARLEMYHIDAYRLENPHDFEMLGFDDFCHPGSVVIIEWADKVRQVLQSLNCLEINISHISPSQRLIKITAAPHYLQF